MASLGRGDAITGACEDHFGELLYGVVGNGEAAVGRELDDGGVFEIAIDNGAQLIELAAACLVAMQAPRLQKPLQTHAHPPAGRACRQS